MTLHYRDVTSLSAADIQQLVEDRVAGGRDLDYKEQLPKATEDDKREFRQCGKTLARKSVYCGCR